MNMLTQIFEQPILLMRIPAIIVALAFHELAHALVAYKLGDRSQEQRGRLTLNPVKHIDPIGILMLLLVGFGWAKPVMVDPRAFRNPKVGMGITSLAGPLTNFLLAFISAILLVVVAQTSNVAMTTLNTSTVADTVVTFLFFLMSINVALGVFNLMPIPPLDGSKVLGAFLPDSLYRKLMQFERFGFIILIGLIFFIPGGLDFLGDIIRDISLWMFDVADTIVGTFT